MPKRSGISFIYSPPLGLGFNSLRNINDLSLPQDEKRIRIIKRNLQLFPLRPLIQEVKASMDRKRSKRMRVTHRAAPPCFASFSSPKG